jgi:macrolide transport system ATP-binding/permease protein
MKNLLSDIKQGLVSLLRSPTFTIAAVLSLALGIGLNTMAFNLINAVFLQPLQVADEERLVRIFTSDQKTKSLAISYYPTSFPNYEDLRDHSTSFEHVVAYAWLPMSLIRGERAEQVNGIITTGNYFDALGVSAARGRTFLPEEDRTEGGHPVVVLSHNLWQNRFAGDVGVVNRVIRLNKREFIVVGVAEEGFQGTEAFQAADFWIPMKMYRAVYPYADLVPQRSWLIFSMFARLADGVSRLSAQAEAQSLANQLSREYPDANEGRGFTLLPINDAGLDPNKRQAMVRGGILLLGIVALILLIACLNVANLQLARGLERSSEFALRLALGAPRRSLFQRLVVESGLLALLGAGLGLAIGFGMRSVLWKFRNPGWPENALDLAFDHRVLLFTLLVALVAAVVSGLLPALQSSNPHLMLLLRDRGQKLSGGRGGKLRVREVLIGLQIAVTLVALTVAGLFIKSLGETRGVDPGFDLEKLMVVTVNLGTADYDEDQGRTLYRRLLERVEALPGVEAAALAENSVLDPSEMLRAFYAEGQEESWADGTMFIGISAVSSRYFEATGIDLVSGRPFLDHDRENSPRVAIINQDAARRFFPGDDRVVGKRFKFNPAGDFIEVVGVAQNAKYNSLNEIDRPYLYLPILQHYSGEVTLHVRTSSDPTTVLGQVRKEIQDIDSSLPLIDLRAASEIVVQSLWASRMSAYMLTGFGLLALVLAIIGSYGIMAYSVNLRTPEIGIRMALGAQRRSVLLLLLRQAALIIGSGILVGLVLNFLLTGFLSSLLFEVEGRDLGIFLGASLILLAVMILASLIPALRATRIDPLVALRARE